jgi:hypothetical protein
MSEYQTTTEIQLAAVEEWRDRFAFRCECLHNALSWAIDVIEGRGMPGENTENSTHGIWAKRVCEDPELSWLEESAPSAPTDPEGE